jgi:small conductance mechanosensitive channel
MRRERSREMEQYMDMGMDWVMTSGVSVVYALVILVVGLWISKLLTKMTRRALSKKEVEPTLVKFGTNILYAILVVFVITATMNKVGIQTTSLIAVIGAAGLAIGLALQGSLANFAAGVLIIIFHPFKVGDVIEGAGVLGSVKELGIFTTVLKTPDNKTIFIPNGSLAGGNITNYTLEDTRRVEMTVGVGYGEDIKKVKEVLTDIITSDERVLKDPEPVVALLELADSSVNFVVRPWTKTEDYWGVYFDTMAAVKLRLDEEGIEIPFPQTDVHLHPVGGEGEAA